MRFGRFIRARTQFDFRLPALALLYLSYAANATAAQAQDTAPVAPNSSPYVLHAYANLVQIPTLLLSPGLYSMPPIARDDVNISLDSGPLFHPTHMRLEGDDPLDLAIFIDLSGSAFALQSALSHSMVDFASRSLRPGDRISIYVEDCIFLRSLNYVSATDGALVDRSLDQAFRFPGLHGHAEDKLPGCKNSIHLWNALATIASSMNDPHGRHIILAISTGADHGSHVRWNQLKQFAGSRSIAIFGLYPELASDKFTLQLSSENPFNSLCQTTGGMVLDTSPTSIGLDLSHVIDLVRNRYILEFPRPDKGKSGLHSTAITLSSARAFIRPAGISYPLPAPVSLSDPTTIPSPPSPAVYGKRRTLASPQ